MSRCVAEKHASNYVHTRIDVQTGPVNVDTNSTGGVFPLVRGQGG